MKKGFTLVELSIVLIIIGLLVGGILTAQSMINTAKISATVKQMQQYDIAVSNFQTRFNCIPGDCPTVTDTNGNSGNGDGLIEETSTGQDDSFNGEIASFWNTLSSLGLIKSDVVYQTGAVTGIRAGVNVPKVSLGKDTGIIVACEWEDGVRSASASQDYADWGGGYNYYHLFSTARSTSSSLLDIPAGRPNLDYSLSAHDALALDTKMDDGNAITGNVRVGSNYERIVFYNVTKEYNDAAGSGCVMSGNNTVYNVASTSSYPCALVIPVLSQVGQN